MSSTPRSTDEVFRNHLALRRDGRVEEDIERNYAKDVVLIAAWGEAHGHDGVRHWARKLHDEIGDATVSYDVCRVEGEVAFLEWSARSDTVEVRDGVDTFLIRNGVIVTKTIHYTVRTPRSA